MKIGIFFSMRKLNGGAYQYALSLLNAVTNIPDNAYIIFNTSPDLPKKYNQMANIETVNLIKASTGGAKDNQPTSKPLMIRIKIWINDLLLKLRLFPLITYLTKVSQKKEIGLIKSKNLDLMVFTMSHKLCALLDLPIIVPIHDLQHRLNPQFPEVSSGNIWNEREYLYSNIARKAAKILVDSEIGKQDVISAYNTTSEKIAIIPFLPPDYIAPEIGPEVFAELKKRYNLPDKFLFYPSQLWPHKNHLNLLKALGLLKDGGLEINLVLTGSKKEKWNTFEPIMALAEKLGIEDQIKYLGYVSNQEMSALYKQATALVMPTFFGPTNIPILEAWEMNCPVLYSDIRGCRQQAGDAALLFDPADPQDMAEKIKLIWTDQRLREDLAAKGRERLNKWTEQDFNDTIKQIIQEFEYAQ